MDSLVEKGCGVSSNSESSKENKHSADENNKL
jgi:hypothetical protein